MVVHVGRDQLVEVLEKVAQAVHAGDSLGYRPTLFGPQELAAAGDYPAGSLSRPEVYPSFFEKGLDLGAE